MPVRTARGQGAERPTQIPARGWKDILLRVKDEVVADHVSVVAAGVAFFGLLAVFPAVAAVISIAGFVLDPADVASQLESLAALLPQEAAAIVSDQVIQVTGGDETATGLAAAFGLGLALYGATKGVMTLIEGMNIAYDEREKRGFIALYLSGIGLTLFLILGLVIAFGAIIVAPMAVAFLGLPEGVAGAVRWIKWPLLALLTMLGLAVLYRFGPSRESPKWRWVSPGAFIATVLWLLGTAAFAVYVRNFGSYNETYGALGGVIVLLTWLWLSAFIVLVGAELNAEMEFQTRRDSTTGSPQPAGHRGAVKADTAPDGLPAEDGDDVAPSRPRQDTLSEVADTVRHRPVTAAAIAAFAVWTLLSPRHRRRSARDRQEARVRMR